METLERSHRVEHIKQRFTRALETYDKAADAQHQISKKLISLLLDYEKTNYKKALEIGCGTGGFTRLLSTLCEIDSYTANDLCSECSPLIEDIFGQKNHKFIAGDAEFLDFGGKYDLIASSSVFQWMKDPKHFFVKLSRLISDRGILLFSTFSPQNLYEIKTITGKGLNYPSMDNLVSFLENNFNIIRVEEESIKLWFNSPIEVLKHLKATGVTATSNEIWTKGMQKEFCTQYQDLYSNREGNIHLTYKPMYILAIKKQELL